MKTIKDKLIEAQQFALSIRPKVGGFPVLAEVLRQSGVQINRWSLPSCQSVFLMEEGAVVQQGTPLITGVHDIPTFNKEALIKALRIDQEGKGTFPEFLHSAWEAGVVSYEVDFTARTVIYYGVNGDSYLEDYPAVDVPKQNTGSI